jgi:hypothetical protein
MKHILNNLSEEEKNAIREQHAGGMKVITENFSKLLNSKLGDSKPLVNEQVKKGPSTDDLIMFLNAVTRKINGFTYNPKGFNNSNAYVSNHPALEEYKGKPLAFENKYGANIFFDKSRNSIRAQNSKGIVVFKPGDFDKVMDWLDSSKLG